MLHGRNPSTLFWRTQFFGKFYDFFREDCWIAFKGMVYNCTPYMEYHPGGGDELMKSAGEDGTELFHQVHRWVNLERILSPCLIGPYIVPKDKQPDNNFLKLPL